MIKNSPNLTKYALFITTALILAAQLIIADNLLITPARAAELQYFEFGSNFSSKSINVADVVTPSQQFRPLDDTLKAIDLWLDNEGSAGQLTVYLRRVSNDQLLASKTVTVPNKPYVWGGNKLHVVFSSPIQVVSTNAYKIEISSSIPNLRLYYSSLVDIQQHDSKYTLNQAVLPAYLGLEEQSFAFKFALYEDADVSDPVISSVVATVISSTETNISFNANEPVDYRVLFAPSGESLTSGTPFSGIYKQCNVGFDPCSISISTEPETTYDYNLSVKDEWGNESTHEGTFTSLEGSPAVDEESESGVPPSQSLSISNARVISSYSNSATIGWTTNIAANSDILVSKQVGQDLTTVVGAFDNTYELEHSLGTGSVLNPKTQYFVRVKSFDSDGSSAESHLTFTTADESISKPEETSQPTSTTTPTETEETSTTTSDTTPIRVIVNTDGDMTVVSLGWDAPTSGAPSHGYRIDIFDSENNLKFSLTSDTNQIDINGLEPGDYKAIVYSNNGDTYEKVGDPIFFSIPGLDKPFKQKTQLYFLFISAGALIAMSLTFTTIRRKRFAKEKKQKKSKQKNNKEAGLTLVEILVSIGIMSGAIALVGLFTRDVSNIGIDYTQRFETEQEINLTINEMIVELRSIIQSNAGSYPISAASTSSITFYTDIKDDGLIDRVRYFLDGTTLKQGVIIPSGDPLTYNPVNETVKDVVHNVVVGTSTIFSYYDENFTGGEPPLTFPVTISEIRMIEVSISAQDTGQISPASFSIRTTPRNLRASQ